MQQLRYMCSQPATDYYAWQIETMLTNFYAMGINPNHIDIVCHKEGCVVPPIWERMAETYPSRFFFYCDTRKNRNYISSIRPNILRQHWEAHPYLQDDIIFYHDCDMLFTKPPHDWLTDNLLDGDEWYGSDVRWYIGHDYILSKGQDVLDAMMDIMGISQDLIKAKSEDKQDIGAQYLMKNVDAPFWYSVEYFSERLFKDINELSNKKKQEIEKYHELQIWCADMWALLWSAWKRGITTKIDTAFNFAWGTSAYSELDSYNIYHNAGITTNANGLFHKAQYINTPPYKLDLQVPASSATAYYYEWVKRTETNTILI